MSFYTFRNKKSKKVFTKEMTNAEREEYLEKHPNVEQLIVKMAVGDPFQLGIQKPPKDFLNKINKMKHTIPGNTLARSRWNHNITEI